MAANNRNFTNANADYQKRIIASDTSNFINANADLLNFISYNRELMDILQEKTIKERNDLKEVILSGAMKRLDSNSPISRNFLKEHFDFAKFIAANLGKIADILNSDKGLARVIVEEGEVTGDSLLSHIANKVSSLLGDSSIVTREFLNDHPEAAIYLLMHPSVLSKVKTTTSEAKMFVAEIGRNTASYNSEIASKANALLNMPYTFSTNFLENDIKFAQVVVASYLNGETLKLAGYIQANSSLTLDNFFPSELIEAYHVDLAVGRFPGDFPMGKEFFSKNKSITSTVTGSEEFVSNLKKETSRLEKFFGSGKFTTDVNDEVVSTIARIYQSPFKSQELQSFSVSIYV